MDPLPYVNTLWPAGSECTCVLCFDTHKSIPLSSEKNIGWVYFPGQVTSCKKMLDSVGPLHPVF